MEKFLFLIREDLSILRKLTQEQHYEAIREMDAWVKKLVETNNFLLGDALGNNGGYVSREHVLSDGPFIEAKEAVSGFLFMSARDLDHAISIAQTCPHVQRGNMIIEVRPMMGLADVRELGNDERAIGR